ncbi:SpaA isopeptide-forming pilin-related protein [Enterococcus faecalis]|uniref:SpaA isopeptide-forming pilin-related protein n=1 Tax=Enterococcus faecalis TaxID=1351 RepID=UPI001CF58A6D|nr:SpaA isopeptide-forming pilin-related protein [Enterococcus faecalis]MCA6712085.1 LPXTG cell wall anchor domain-containing protein [Enterococcus faecalis]MCA6731083.1 LPXTG cell wall anchor domain-containing protein [Enterococcus faecalis]
MRLKKLFTLFTLAVLGVNSLTPVTQVVAEELPSIATTEISSSESTSSTTEISKEETTEKTQTSSSEKEKTSETKENEISTQTQPSTDMELSESTVNADNSSPDVAKGEEQLYSSDRSSYTYLEGTETELVKAELLAFMDAHTQEIQAIKGASYEAHVGFTASNGQLYEFIPVESPARLRRAVEERAGITIQVVRQFSVNWHVRMPNSGLETWGAIYDEMATPDGKPLFCIEPGILVNGFGGYTQTVMPSQITTRMKQGATIGYTKTKDIPHYWNTQTFLWDELGVQWIQNSGRNQGIINEIHNGIANLAKRPSFNNQQVTLKVGQSVTLTDTNGVFKDYQKMSSNTAGVKVEKNGNQLKLTATASSNETGNVSFLRYSEDPNNIAYVKPGSQTVAVLGDPDRAKISIPIKVLKNGNVKIKKVDADTGKAISGAKFKLSYGGRNVEVVTNANGEADLKDIPHGTKVTITEIQAANGYVLNKTPQTVTIEANKTITVTFKNKKQVGRLDLIKEDKETGNQAQGSAKLEGAVYGLFETNGQKVKEVTLKKSGDKVTGSFENIQIMHDYYVQEIKAPEGYTLDKTKYPVNIAYAGQDKTVAVKTMTLKDQVIKGGVEIVKIGDKPLVKKVLDTITGKADNIKPQLEGAEFTITSKTTGKVVKVMTTDKNGKASTGKTLPYDSYVMKETKTPEGYLPIEPIEFTISEEDQKFFWVLEDKIIEARLHLVKVDAETGKNIPLRDTTFKIWDRWANDGKGDYVSMRVPNSLEISDEFKTNEKGEFVTSDSLPFGKDRYEIRELRAPEGYLLATEPVVFSVTEADAGGVITIKFENMPQKGQVKIHKTGEKGISTVEKECEYGKYAEIQYDQVDLAGVKFKIRAREDITTPDGTVRLAKGEYVQKDGKDFELVTNDLGMTESEPNLYLGKYEAVEIEAPNGFVLLKDPIPFEIKYEGQLVELASTTVKVENQLQEINVYGYKKQEVVTGWEDGKPVIELENAKNGQVFGLFVGEGGIQIGFDILPHDTALAFAKVKDGKLSFEGLTLPNVESNFYLKEIDAGNDHVLDETKYGFKYEPSTNEKEHTIHVFADGYDENKEILTKMARKEIENKLAYTDVELLKTDNLGNKPLEGIEFQLIRVDGKKETVVNTYKTDKDGKIAVKKLPTGNYKFKETKPLKWYYPNADNLSFEVTPETNGQVISLKAVNKRKPMEITTLLATVDGKKEANPTIDNTLRDEVKIKGSEVGHTYTIVTPYVDPETKKVITTVESTYTAKAENETIHVDIPIAKNTMKDGQKGVATHYIYYDKEKTKLVGKEDNLANKDQTVTFKTPKALPKTGETANVAYVALGLFLFVCASVVLVRRKVKE